MEFKDMLKRIRKERGLSQVELAERLGVSKSLIAFYETGGRKPSYEVLEDIADFFNYLTLIYVGISTFSFHFVTCALLTLRNNRRKIIAQKREKDTPIIGCLFLS